jgi:hypothetical protein
LEFSANILLFLIFELTLQSYRLPQIFSMKNESIDKILDELERTRQFLMKFRDTGKMPDIERDIVLAKLRNMYEFVQLVQPEIVAAGSINVASVIDEKEPEVHVEPIESKPVTIEFDNSAAEKLSVPEEKELEIESVEEVIIKPQVKSSTTTTVKKEILAEKFQTQSFLNEALSQFQNVTDLSKKMQNQPLKDIFSAINLNDKFLFIKELFNNDAALYQSTVEKVNNAGNFNDAVRYLDGNFSWDFNEQMVQKFLELVRRRFM